MPASPPNAVMDHEQGNAEDGGVGGSVRGLVGVGVLGVSLWAQLMVPALLTELRLPAAQMATIGLYFVPLLVLGVGIAVRSGLVTLLLFPLALLPGLASLPLEDQVAATDAWAMARIAVSLAVFLALSSAWVAEPVRRSVGVVRASAVRRRGSLYRGFVASRLVPLLLLFVVPTYAIFFDPAVVSTLAQNHPGSHVTAQIFLSMVIFFVWSVAAYTSFLVPALNLEYDGRRLSQQAAGLARGLTRGRVLRRIGVTTLLVGAFAAAVLMLATW